MALRAITAPNADMGSRHWWSSLLATWMCGLAEPKDFGSSWSFTELNSKRVNSSVFQQPAPKHPVSFSCCINAAPALVKQPDKRLRTFPVFIVLLPHLSIPLRMLHKKTTPPALNKCRSGGGYIIVGHVFLQLPVSVSSGNKQGYAWLALHEAAAKRGPRRGILQLTHSYRWGSENCNLHFLPPPLLSTGG